jgi:pyruvate carboxylase subunit B
LGDEKPIDCRPADLLEPEFEKRREELAKEGIETSDENVLLYALFPQTGLKFLKGEIEEEPFPSAGKVEGKYEVEIEGKRYQVEIEPA